MNQESMKMSSDLLDMLSQLLDESTPQELLPMIARVACQALRADAAVLEIPAELANEPFRFAYPSSVAISSSAVRRAREEKKAILWNQVDGDAGDVSKSIVRNRLTSIMVAPFQTLSADVVSGFLYLQREARRDPFGEEEKKLFDKFVSVSEKIAYSAYNRQSDRETLDAFRGVTRKGSIVYVSKGMSDVISQAEKFIALPTPIIIRGETGTGKEVLARWIHSQSPRAEKPFVAINCGAIPENLIESILFGHVRGSFSGAIDTRKGVFEEADGGTLFLDEIGDLPLGMQVKLLRVLQEHRIARVGGQSGNSRQRAHHFGNARGFGTGDEGTPLSGRSLLPHPGDVFENAAAPGTRAGRAPSRRRFCQALRLRIRPWKIPFFPCSGKGAARVFLAGECAGVGKSDSKSPCSGRKMRHPAERFGTGCFAGKGQGVAAHFERIP